MQRFVLFLVAVLVCSNLFGQVEIEKRERLAVVGAKSAEIVGARILVDSDSALTISKAVVLAIKTDFKFVRLKARKNGAKFAAESLSASEWLFEGEGAYSVEVIAFDPEKGIEESEIDFLIGAGPKPPEPPQPGPGPDPIVPAGPFDDLAKRVAEAAKGISDGEKAKYNAAFREVIRKMETFEIRRIEEARTFISGQKLTGNKLNELLNDDAKKRGSLSFSDAIAWFREVERGTR